VNRRSGLRERLSVSLVKTRTLENRMSAARDPRIYVQLDSAPRKAQHSKFKCVKKINKLAKNAFNSHPRIFV
jgi:hypothetical protein